MKNNAHRKGEVNGRGILINGRYKICGKYGSEKKETKNEKYDTLEERKKYQLSLLKMPYNLINNIY